MAETQAAAIPGVTPYLTISGGRGEDAVGFYGRAFGAVEQMRHLADDNKPGRNSAFLRAADRPVMAEGVGNLAVAVAPELVGEGHPDGGAG